MKTDELWWANMNNMNHNFPKHGRTKNLDSEVVSVHGRDLCGKCNSLCCSKCHVCSLEFYGAVWSCMEPWHSHLIHLDPSLIIFIAGWMWWWHPTSWKQWLPGGSTCQRLNAMLQQVLQRFKGQGFVCWSLEFIVTYSDHWPRRKGLEDLRALYPEVIQEVLQCRVPFPLMRGELTWSNMAGGFKLFQIISYNLQHSANILWHLWPKNSFRHDTWLDMTWHDLTSSGSTGWPLKKTRRSKVRGPGLMIGLEFHQVGPLDTSGQNGGMAARRHGQISTRQLMKSTCIYIYIYIYIIYNDNDICVLQTVEWKHLTFKSGGRCQKASRSRWSRLVLICFEMKLET